MHADFHLKGHFYANIEGELLLQLTTITINKQFAGLFLMFGFKLNLHLYVS